MIKYLTNKGLTLIELCVCVSIMLGIVSVSFDFFVNNYFASFNITNKIIIQDELSNLNSKFADLVIQSKGLKSNVEDTLDLNTNKKVTFLSNEGEDISFVYDKENKSIYCSDRGNYYEIGRYIDSFKISPIYKNKICVAIEYTIVASVKKQQCSLSNRIYFRNI